MILPTNKCLQILFILHEAKNVVFKLASAEIYKILQNYSRIQAKNEAENDGNQCFVANPSACHSKKQMFFLLRFS